MTSVQEHNIKSDQAINKIIAQEIEKAINTYIEKFNQELDSELENA
ncbi:8915_t:CDS:1, partial [Diversispora eburnea]